MLHRTVGLMRGVLCFAVTLWNMVSMIFLWVMLLMSVLLVLAVVVGGIVGIVWMYRHDGPAKFFTNVLVMAVLAALMERGFELLDRAGSTERQHGGSP